MKIKPRIKEELKKFLIDKQKAEGAKARVISAHKLSEEELKMLYQLFPDLEDKKIENVIDESLLAGVIVQKGSKIIDLSLKTRMNEFKKTANEIY